MLARDVMSDGVMSVTSDASVLDAAVLMVNLRVSALTVLDADGVLQGIVTESDLVGGLYRQANIAPQAA